MSYCLERAAYIDFCVLFFSSPRNNTQVPNLHFDGFSAWVTQKMDIIWKRYGCWSCSVLLFPRLYQLYNPDLLFLPVQSLYKRAKQTGDDWGYVPSLKDTTAPLHAVELLWPIFHLKHSELLGSQIWTQPVHVASIWMIRLPASAQSRETWFAMARICFVSPNLKLHATWPRVFFWPLIYISNCTIHAWCGVALPPPLHISQSIQVPKDVAVLFFSSPAYISQKSVLRSYAVALFSPSHIWNLDLYFSQKRRRAADVASAWSLCTITWPFEKSLLYIFCKVSVQMLSLSQQMKHSAPPKQFLSQPMSSVESPASLTPSHKTIAQIHNKFPPQVLMGDGVCESGRVKTYISFLKLVSKERTSSEMLSLKILYTQYICLKSRRQDRHVVCFSLLPGNMCLFKILRYVVCSSHLFTIKINFPPYLCSLVLEFDQQNRQERFYADSYVSKYESAAWCAACFFLEQIYTYILKRFKDIWVSFTCASKERFVNSMCGFFCFLIYLHIYPQKLSNTRSSKKQMWGTMCSCGSNLKMTVSCLFALLFRHKKPPNHITMMSVLLKRKRR